MSEGPPDAGPPVVGVILAGGQSRRMGGGDKCLLPLGGRALLEHVTARAAGQVRRLVLNANGDASRFARFRLPVIADGVPDHPGPLAGVLAGMEWAHRHAPDYPWIATFPGDAPFLPRDLVGRLLAHARERDADVSVAEGGGRRQHLAAVWSVALAGELRRAICDDGIRRVEAFQARCRTQQVPFGNDEVPFLNVNAPADLRRAEHFLETGEA